MIAKSPSKRIRTSSATSSLNVTGCAVSLRNSALSCSEPSGYEDMKSSAKISSKRFTSPFSTDAKKSRFRAVSVSRSLCAFAFVCMVISSGVRRFLVLLRNESLIKDVVLLVLSLRCTRRSTQGPAGRLAVHPGGAATAWMALYLCLFGRRDGGSVDRERAAARLCWRQHSLENDFAELLGKGQPRYADQIAGALRPRLGVGFFAHLARDCKRLIDIDDIERLFHYVVECGPKLCQDLCSVGIGHPHLLCHHREVGRLAGIIERRGRDHGPLVVLAELARHMDRVSDLDRLCIAVVVFRRHTVIGGLLANRCGRVLHIRITLFLGPPGYQSVITMTVWPISARPMLRPFLPSRFTERGRWTGDPMESPRIPPRSRVLLVGEEPTAAAVRGYLNVLAGDPPAIPNGGR